MDNIILEHGNYLEHSESLRFQNRKWPLESITLETQKHQVSGHLGIET